MNLKSKKGFTLVELIIVIAILGIIALIAVPSLTGIQKRSQVNADIRTAETIAKAITICVTEDRVVSAGNVNDLLAAKWINLNTIETDIAGIDFDEYIDITLKPKSAKVPDGNGAYYVRYVKVDKSGKLLPVPRVVVAINKGGSSVPASAATIDTSALPYDASFSDEEFMIACINGLELTTTNIATYDLQHDLP